MTAFYVIPCSAGKLDRPAAAREFYTGSMFRNTLAAAEAAQKRHGGRVLILSAKYGLVGLRTQLHPYNVKMGDPGSVSADYLDRQRRSIGVGRGDRVYLLLPSAYRLRMAAALVDSGARVINAYEGARGIGDQRATNGKWIRGEAPR